VTSRSTDGSGQAFEAQVPLVCDNERCNATTTDATVAEKHEHETGHTMSERVDG
jgi:hypothetical protein